MSADADKYLKHCMNCWYWNTTLKDKGRAYRCHGYGCPDIMLLPEFADAKREAMGWPKKEDRDVL